MVPKPPAPLVDYLHTGRCVLFVGSGLSAAAKLPTWSDLLQGMIDEISSRDPNRPQIAELEQLLKDGKLLEVADQCKEELTKQRYMQVLSEKLRADKVDIPEQHKVISKLKFSAVVTTNYDKLLERTYASIGSVPKVLTHLQTEAQGTVLFENNFFILKAHGDIDEPKSLILTARDYSEIIHSNQAFNSLFSAILLTKAILFVGYSLSDPDFRLLLDRQLTIFNGYMPPRYALMSGLNSVESYVLKRTASIDVIPYDKGQHDQVLTFLQSLSEEVDKKEPTTISREIVSPAPVESTSTPPAQITAVIPALPTPIPLTKLSIRLSGGKIEVTLNFKTSSISAGRSTANRSSKPTMADIFDMSSISAIGEFPNWAELTELFNSKYIRNKEGSFIVGKALTELLPSEILTVLKKIPSEQTIVLQLSAELEPLPWEWIYVGGKHLFLRNPTVRAPISISDKARGYPLIHEPVRVLLIGQDKYEVMYDGQDKYEVFNLFNVREEIEKISELYLNRDGVICQTLVGPQQVTFDAVVRELQIGYDIIHFAGLTDFDAQEPSIALDKDVYLRANELRSFISQRPPAILLLNSRYTAFIPPGRQIVRLNKARQTTSETTTGSAVSGQGSFSEVALAAGVGAFIGSFGEPADDVGFHLGVSFHQELLEGQPVAHALYRARLSCKRKFKPSEFVDLTWMEYIVSGYGELALPFAPQQKPKPRTVSSGKKRSASKKR